MTSARLEKIEAAKVASALLDQCFARVWKLYEKTADKIKGPDGERDYDAAAKGPTLLKAMQAELKKRLNPKKKS